MVGNMRETGRKRRNRVPVSCFGCRALKTKCDGVRPICSTCARSGRDCVFDQQGATGGAKKAVLVNQEYLRTLEKRLELLAKKSSPLTLHNEGESSRQESTFGSHSENTVGASSSVVVDANVSIGGASFPQLILTALHGHEKVKARSMTTDRDVRSQSSILTGEDLYTLPCNAAEILDRFFSFRNILTPIFHVPSVQPVFDAAMQCAPEERYCHQSAFVLLNMIFALCTSHWSVDSLTTARRHYDIAMTLMQPTLLRDWSLEHVQALVIAARYLQGSNAFAECWNVLGLAIRIAYGLRLHQDPPETDTPPLRETKRRVWYAIYTLDMHLSMIYERPSATRSNEFSVRPPEDLDDNCINKDGLLYPMPQRPSSMSFFLEVIKLYHIVENTLSQLSSVGENGRKIAELVIALDEDHQKWRNGLPPQLVLDYNDINEPTWILALRSNMVRILIHRQSLVVTLNGLVKPQQIEASIVNHALQHSRSICVAAAMETVQIVALRHEQTRQTMGLNWFNIYYLFNAVIVLVSHVVDPAYANDKPALARVDKALHMIKAMSNNHSFAQRAYTFLQQLLNYMHPTVAARQDGFRSEEAVAAPSQTPLADPLPATLESDTEVIPGLHALFGFTQNLSDNLESQLETFDTRGLDESLWTFNESGLFHGIT